MNNTDNNWRKVWNKRKLDDGLRSTLEQLIAADGFDSSFGGFMNASDWNRYVEHIATRLGMQQPDSLFEVGCGAGAFLYPFYEKGSKVGGIDFAENLIEIARKAMPGAQLTAGEAIRMQEGAPFDYVTAHSVFYYFPDHGYAADVLRRMAKVAVKGIGVFDVPDASKKDEAIRYRKATLGDREYERRYTGLDHLYYEKDWFSTILGSEDFDIVIEEQSLAGYGNARFRFNVFIRRL